jgi:hypothetical protein
MREGKEPSRKAIYRFFRDTLETGVDICLLSLADIRATNNNYLPEDTWKAGLEVVRKMLESWFEKRNEAIDPKLLISGDELMAEFSIPPGIIVGTLLEAIREAQAAGEISTRNEAIQFARKMHDEMSTHG